MQGGFKTRYFLVQLMYLIKSIYPYTSRVKYAIRIRTSMEKYFRISVEKWAPTIHTKHKVQHKGANNIAHTTKEVTGSQLFQLFITEVNIMIAHKRISLGLYINITS